MTNAERHQRWINKPGNKEKRRASNKAWRAANAERIRELRNKPQTVANKKAYRQRPEIRAAERIGDRERLKNPRTRAFRLLANAKGRAVKYNLTFSITVDDIQSLLNSRTVCPYTNQPFDFSGPLIEGVRKNPWSPSIDRVNPTLGYVRENIEIVSTWYNLAKNQWPPEIMRAAIAGLVANYKF